jgi:hypothetical protein
MSVDVTSLYEDILRTFNRKDGVTRTFYRWECELYANGKIIKVLGVQGTTLERNFLDRVSDIVGIEVTLGMGDFIYDVYPARDNLKAMLYRIPVYPNTEMDHDTGSIVSQLFDAVLWNPRDLTIMSGGSAGASKGEANRAQIYPFKLQLVDPRWQAVRLYEFSAPVEDITREDLLRYVLTIPDGIDKISVVPPSVKEKVVYETVPVGVTIESFPGWLQEYGGGVYNAGIGWYFQKGQWFVYPTYDTTRFTTEEEVITICNVPPERMAMPESTYRQDGKQLYVLATGKVQFTDTTQAQELMGGNGVRYGRADIMSQRDEYDNGEIYLNREANSVAVVGNPRKDGLTVAPSSGMTTNNHAVEMSKIAAQRGAVLTFEWQNSNVGLLKPGMPARFFYAQNKRVIMMEGTVLSATQTSTPSGQGLANRTHQQNAVVTLFLNAQEKGKIDGQFTD